MKRSDALRSLSRREALGLSGVALVGFTSLAGCTGDGSEPSPTANSTTVSKNSPEVTGANVTVGYGETKTVTLTGKHVGRMYFSSAPAEVGYGPINFGGVTFEPTSPTILASMPPQWEWNPPAQEVDVTVPVSAPENGSDGSTDSVPPGSHEFTVTGVQDDQSAESSLMIHVSPDSTTDG